MEKLTKIEDDKTFVECICDCIIENANKNINTKGSFTLVLSGGRTPVDIFKELVCKQEEINWEKVHLFWVDERYVSTEDNDNNYMSAYKFLISKLNKIGSVNRIETELSPEEVVDKYRSKINNFFKGKEIIFDFILLGMGEDGHIASLFPESTEMKLKDELVMFTNKIYSGYNRITLGLNTINNCKYKLLILKGENKIKLLLERDEKLPVNMIEYSQIIVGN